MRVVFMGTPDFAVPCLQQIIDNKYEVVGVFTQPDKPKGRGHKVLPPPVKALAMEHSIPVYQPKTFKDEETISLLKKLKCDIIIVVAYGKLLPETVLDIPKYGCVNIHASLLPKYRGAGPIQWSVLNGEKTTGATSMYMAKGLDTGDMIFKSTTDIGENETSSELHDRLSVLGSELLIKTIKAIESGNAPREVQDDSMSCYAPMLSKDMSIIDFTKTADLVHNQIRGLSTWPCALTSLNGKRLKVYKSEVVKEVESLKCEGEWRCGEIIDNKKFIVACADKTAVKFVEVQYEGSKRMNSEDFLRGKNIQDTVICGV